MRIFTIGSDETKLCYLKQSAEMGGMDISFVVTDGWNGYVDKIITMQKILEDVPDDEVVCFIDAYDVVAFCDNSELLQKFKAYDCDLVLSGELTCYPEKYKSTYDDIYASANAVLPSNFKYVNSGGYIGYKRAIADLLAWKPLDEIHAICEKGGDQNYFTEYFLAFGADAAKKLKIDVAQNIFQSMNKIEFGDFEFVDGRLRNKILDTTPCFAHFNGYNTYKLEIMNLHTYTRENALDVFVSKARNSRDGDKRETLHYSVPFFILIDGVLQPNLSQK
jgi:hypothetical protein